MPFKKRLLIATALSALGLTATLPASAQVSRFYLAGYLGLSTYNDLGYSDSVSSTNGDLNLENGHTFTGALGLRLSPQLRAEIELSHNDSALTSIHINGSGDYGMGGAIDSLNTMLNVYYDFDVPWDVQPFIGAGIGYGFFDAKMDDSSGLASSVTTDDGAYTWQVGGGLKYRVSPELAFTGSYRYLDSSDLEFGGYTVDYGDHEFRLGLEWDISVW